MKLTDLIEQLERLDAAATKGPWYCDEVRDSSCGRPCTPDGCHEMHPSGVYQVDGPDWEPDGTYSGRLDSKPDGELIALIGTHRSAILAHLKRLAELENTEHNGFGEYGRP